MDKFDFARLWLRVFINVSEDENKAHEIARQLRSYRWSNTINLELQLVIRAICHPDQDRTILTYWIAQEWLVRAYQENGHVNIGWKGTLARMMELPYATVDSFLEEMIKEVKDIDAKYR